MTPEAKPDMADRLRDEADLCRNEGATDIAVLLDEAADELETLRAQVAQYKADAERLLTSILTRTYGTEQRSAEADDLRALIERQPDDTDGEMWRFCVERGQFPGKFARSDWSTGWGMSGGWGKPLCDTPAEAVQAAMKEKA